MANQANLVKPPVRVQTHGGEVLTVDFEKIHGDVEFKEVFLEGSAKIVFEGTIIEI